MATTNQRNRSGGQKGSQGGSSKLQKAASDASHSLSSMRDDVTDHVSEGTERFGQMTRGHEGQAVLLALAAGVGLGFVIGCSLATANRRPKSWSDRLMSEGMGKKLLERMERIMPDAVTERFGR